ncbi:hypothetical protein [Jiangella endophytica]|uniref:hypothetical protein n=1 Tax=Jiangella endophytica TaxID=1623398 RepID=UPI000E342620|nr:hypothetical protein [Jiangella endophytica]
MTDDDLKHLFAQAVLDEPDRIVSPDDDIARGRALRTRRRRRRIVAGVVAVVAAGTLGLVVPDAFVDLRAPGVEAAAPGYDELPPFDPEPGMRFLAQPRRTSGDGAAEVEVEVQESAGVPESATPTMPSGMLAAVENALPDDVEFAGGEAPAQAVGRHRLVYSVERDGTPFTLRVWWQTGAMQSRAFRPCTEPVAAFSRTAVWDDCTQSPDHYGTVRVLGSPDPQHRVLALDGSWVAITVVWETPEAEPATRPGDVLSDGEAERIGDAVWGVALDSMARLTGSVGGNLAELRSDFGMGYVAESWANVEAALTRALGPLTRVRIDRHEPGPLNDPQAKVESPQAVTASYRTSTGGTVNLAVWDTGVIYGALCTNLLACDVWPGSREYFKPLLMSPSDVLGGTALGNQGQAYLVLDGVSGDVAALHRATMQAVFSVLPDPS